MNLIDIDEPNITTEDTNSNCAIGIDLGTTNSLIAYSENHKPQILHGKDQAPEIKSLINIDKSGQITIGKDDDQDVITLRSIKRLMGKSIDDLDDNLHKYQYSYAQQDRNNRLIKLVAGKVTITPIEAQAEILKTLTLRAENILQKKITQAVITVPAYFDDAGRQATKDAASLAGLEVLRLLNEPTAAAIAYGLDNKVEGYYAIYDFGGGTFDVSILKMVKGVFQVIATKGDNFLGGDDIDMSIYHHLKNIFNISELSNIEQTTLLNTARQIKEYFSSNNSNFKQKLNYQQNTLSIDFSYNDYTEIITPIIHKTINILDEAIKDAKINISDIKEFILVGGSTKIPYVKKLLTKHIKKTPLDTVNPDTVVAIGAAIQAENLTKGTGDLLLDIIPLSLGIETMGDVVEKIIPRNSTIPIAVSQEFTTYKDNQTGMKIHIVQGERELASQNRSLAFFELRNIPAMPAGKAKVTINFNVDTDGILTVSAMENTTKIIQKIQVKPSYGLTTDEMQKMLSESYINAKSDMLQRMLHKNFTDIEQFIDVINNMVSDQSLDFTQQKKDEIYRMCQTAMKDAKKFLKQNKLQQLDELQKNLKQYINDLSIEKVSKITESLKGQDITNIDHILNTSH